MARFVFIALLVGASASRAPTDTELPAVASMMNASAHTLGRISKHVEKIGSHMSDLISQQKSELAQQKVEYEQKLKSEAEENTKLETENEKESASIWELEKNNDDLRAQAKQLQKETANLRKAFNTVEAKVSAVTKFSKKALDADDDENSPDLAVLSQKDTKEKESDEDNEQDAEIKKDEAADSDSKDEDAAPAKDSDAEQAKDSDAEQDADSNANSTATQDSDSESDDKQSFLAISAKTRRARRTRRDDHDGDNQDDDQEPSAEEASSDSTSEEDESQAAGASQNATRPASEDSGSQEMVNELTKEINQLSQQQDKSRAELSKLFQARFKKGADKKAQILAKQELLNSTKASLTKLNGELHVAVKHLKGTKAKLENQLHGLGHYLAQLATYVTEPAADAEKALPSLPTDVQTFLQKKN